MTNADSREETPNPVTRVCEAIGEVEQAGYEGFVLKEVIYADRITTAREYGSTTQQSPVYTMTAIDVTKPFVTRVPLFVMQQSGDQALMNLKAKIEGYQVEARALRAAESEATQKLVVAQKAVAESAGVSERFRQSLEKERADHQKLRETNRKLESDLGKVRTAIGDLRMKEILAVEEKT